MSNSREFTKIFSAAFVSQVGSHFLTLALSAFVLVTTGSIFKASTVFVVSYLPSILVSARLGALIDQRISKWLYAGNEFLSTVASLLCGVCIYERWPFLALCVVLGLRSMLMFVSRSCAMKWIKSISPSELQAGRAKLFFLTFFISTAIAGISAGIALSQSSILLVVGLDILTYLLSGNIILLLDSSPVLEQRSQETVGSQGAVGLLDTVSAIFQSAEMRTSFLFVCLSQAFFQGAYSVLVSSLPIHHFNIGMKGVGLFQIAASVGITGGFLLNWFVPGLFREIGKFPWKSFLWSLAAALSLVLCVSTGSLMLSISLFCLLNFTYECVWLQNSSLFFQSSPREEVARFQFTLSSVASFAMSIVTMVYAVAMESFGFMSGTLIVIGIGGLAALVLLNRDLAKKVDIQMGGTR